MRPVLFFSVLFIILLGCQSNVKESTVHRRNFAKNVFEEEFASVQVGCDTTDMEVLLPNTKWLKIDPEYASKRDLELHVFKLNKKLSLKERTYEHDLILEKIDNGAFMFRYTGVQTVIDTLEAINLSDFENKLDAKMDSTKIFGFEGKHYYKLNETQARLTDSKTIYKTMRTEDQGRVVCKCDYFID